MNQTLKLRLALLLSLSYGLYAGPDITPQGSFAIESPPSRMAFSSLYNLLFTMRSNDLSIYDAATGQLISRQSPLKNFTDLDISPDGRYLFAADFGGGSTGSPQYVHRYDMATRQWEVGISPNIAYRLEAVSGELVLLLEDRKSVV